MTPIRANIAGPSCSATSNSASIAACHSSASCSALGNSSVMYSAASRSVASGFRPGSSIGSKNRWSQDTGSGEPQCQLAVRTEVAVDERRYRRGQGITGKIKAAQYLPRDILRSILSPMFGGVECDFANGVPILARHQIANESFEVGLL